MKIRVLSILVLLSCNSYKISNSESEILNSLSDFLHSEYPKNFVLSPYSSQSILESDIVAKDSLGNIVDYHFIADGYTTFSRYKDSLDFLDLKDNYLLSNNNSILIQKHFKSITYDTLAIDNFKSIFHTDNTLSNQWASFYKNYPDVEGYLIISRPGISTDKKWAIIFYEIQQNSLDGEGKFVLFKKISNKWKVIESINKWVS